MRSDIWSRPSPRLFARRFQYTKGDYGGLTVASDELRRCLTLPLADALKQVFGYESTWFRGAREDGVGDR